MPKTHPIYDHDFRAEAVKLLLSGGRPLKRLADELGVSANSLRNWRNQALAQGRGAQGASAEPSGRSGALLSDAAGEIRRLQRENEYLRRSTRDLKKSGEHTLGGPAERYALINLMRDDYSIFELCDALDVSRSAYYAARTRRPSPRQTQNQTLLASIKPIHKHRFTRAYGSPRMTRELQLLGLTCSENRVAR